ncbi:hypothetical protein BLOT_013247, partial [Blomia tropicalis]
EFKVDEENDLILDNCSWLNINLFRIKCISPFHSTGYGRYFAINYDRCFILFQGVDPWSSHRRDTNLSFISNNGANNNTVQFALKNHSIFLCLRAIFLN